MERALRGTMDTLMQRSALALVCLWAGVAAAGPERPERRRHRELNGHYFIPSLSVADPFVPTEAAVITGAGAAWANGPGFDARANQVGRDPYFAAAIAETGEFQANIFDGWAIRLTGAGGLFGGFNARSALVIGATTQLDVIPGTTVSWQIGRYVRLGGTLDFDYEHERSVIPLLPLAGSLALGQVDLSQALERVTVWQLIPGATVAVAPNAATGIVVAVQYLWLHESADLIDTDVHNLVVGVTAELDLEPLAHHVPLAFLAAYRAEVPFDAQRPATHDLEGGLYYSGKRDLVLGVVTRGRWFDLRPGIDTAALIGNVVMRYYWN
jgi:hypothetical protein